ncbi:MAG TPA: SIMPL domain-containing protein, partial [Thermomicrobiales bacterium]|nr:SIMPL domain-containing protein [Thermomicrobiales bacterium]
RRAQLDPIVNALTEQGIKADTITLVISPIHNDRVSGPSGVAVGRIDVTVSKPTLDKLTALFATVQQAAATEQLALGQIGATYHVKDCQALNQDARKAAIEDARANAKTQADLLGIQTGPITASADLVAGSPLTLLYGLPFAGGCTPPTPPLSYGDLGLDVSLPTFDPAAEPSVTVYAQVSLTFAIAAG